MPPTFRTSSRRSSYVCCAYPAMKPSASPKPISSRSPAMPPSNTGSPPLPPTASSSSTSPSVNCCPGPEPDPVLQVTAEQCVAILEDALEEMSPKVRATFLLHRRDGLSMDEISARLGITKPMAKKYLVKALARFRQQLLHIEHGCEDE